MQSCDEEPVARSHRFIFKNRFREESFPFFLEPASITVIVAMNSVVIV